MEEYSEQSQLKKHFGRYLNYAREINWPIEQTALGGVIAIVATYNSSISELHEFEGEAIHSCVSEFEHEYFNLRSSSENFYFIPYDHPALSQFLRDVHYLRLRLDEDLLPLLDELLLGGRTRNAESYTPDSLASLLIEIIGVQPNSSIFDPCVGSGSFFTAAQEYLQGQKFVFEGADKISFNVVLAQLKAILSGENHRNIYIGSAFALSANLAQYDFVVSNPPIGKLPQREAEHRYYNVLQQPSSEMSMNYVELGLKHLKPNGRAAFLVPMNVLFAGGDIESIRHKWIESGILLGVVTLAPNLLFHTGLKCAALIFENNRNSNGVRLVRGEDCFTEGAKRRNMLSRENIQELVTRFHNLTPDNNVLTVKHSQLAEKGYILIPDEYYPKQQLAKNTLSDNWQELGNIAQVLRGSSLAKCEKGDTPVVRGKDIRTEQIDLDSLARKDLSTYHKPIQVCQKNDILIQRIGANPAAYLITEREAGLSCEETVFIVRFVELSIERIDFICQFLNSGQVSSRYNNARSYSVIPTQTLKSITQLEVPIAAQKIISTVQAMNDLEKQLKTEYEKSLELKNALFNGLEVDLSDNLLNAQYTANALEAALKTKDDISYRLRTQYPFPLAYAYRNIYAERELASIYERQMKYGEQFLLFLASIGLALVNKYIDECDKPLAIGLIEKFDNDVKKALSPGDIYSCLQACCRTLSSCTNNELAQQYQQLWFKTNNKETEFAKITLEQIVKRLNDHKHHRGPSNRHERSIAIEEQQSVINELLATIDFCAKWRIILVEDIERRWRNSELEYSVSVLQGDHPAFARSTVITKTDLVKDKLYLQTNEEFICLYPLLSLNYNPQTKREEIFSLDKYTKKSLSVKSFDSGTTIESSVLKSDLEYWVDNLKHNLVEAKKN
jgi:hypothetical protein